MPGDYQSVSDRSNGVSLDRMPDSPPDRSKGPEKHSLGEFGNSPGLMALRGLEQIENGLQLVTAGAPGLPPPLMQAAAIMLTQLRQAVPQALSGSRSPMVPSGMLTPPGMGGMGAPPGIGAQGGAPVAPSPLSPGMGQ